MINSTESFFKICVNNISWVPSLKESRIDCLNTDKFVIVDRPVLNPCCSFIIIFLHREVSFLFINLENSLGIIEIFEIGR